MWRVGCDAAEVDMHTWSARDVHWQVDRVTVTHLLSAEARIDARVLRSHARALRQSMGNVQCLITVQLY